MVACRYNHECVMGNHGTGTVGLLDICIAIHGPADLQWELSAIAQSGYWLRRTSSEPGDDGPPCTVRARRGSRYPEFTGKVGSTVLRRQRCFFSRWSVRLAFSAKQPIIRHTIMRALISVPAPSSLIAPALPSKHPRHLDAR